ncbi:hypothetical protein ILUMI_20127, partial [Ignelater luminosus]
MEFKRNSVIALYLAGKSQSAIVRELEHIKVNRKFVYRTINRYNETGSVVKRYGGGPKKTATSPEMVRKVKKRLERNPRRSGNQMAKELNISQSSIRRILQNELQVKAYKKQKAHDLTPNQKKVRFERAKELLRLAASGEFPNIVFSDEKNFPIEQFVNTQNDRVYLTERTYENLKHRLVTRSNYPSQIMVWAAVTATGRSPLVFIEPGVKVKIDDKLPGPVILLESVNKNNEYGTEIRMTPDYAVQKIFSSELEDSIEQYLVTCSKMCYGLDTLETRRLAYEMAKYHNLKIPKVWVERQMAGIDWLYGFRKRHPEIRLRKPEACSLSRATSFNRLNVQKFFDNLFDILQRYSNSGEAAPSGTLFFAQSTRWMTSELFANVIRHFIKMTSSKKKNPTLVIMDNHESHLVREVLNIAKENGVILLTIPPHTSHKVQALDVSVFGPFQDFYNAPVDSCEVTNRSLTKEAQLQLRDHKTPPINNQQPSISRAAVQECENQVISLLQ